jgi:hypothetical protein
MQKEYNLSPLQKKLNTNAKKIFFSISNCFAQMAMALVDLAKQNTPFAAAGSSSPFNLFKLFFFHNFYLIFRLGNKYSLKINKTPKHPFCEGLLATMVASMSPQEKDTFTLFETNVSTTLLEIIKNQLLYTCVKFNIKWK